MDSIIILTRLVISMMAIASAFGLICYFISDRENRAVSDITGVIAGVSGAVAFFSFIAILLIFVIRELKK